MVDNNGILYFTEKSKDKEIIFGMRPQKKNKEDKSLFYEFIGDDNLIIKCYSEKSDIDQVDLYEMILLFNRLKDKILGTDLPNIYYAENNQINGLIVPYYKNGISLYQLTESHSLSTLKEHYNHDDDKIHNLYVLCFDILDKLEELADNNIMYYDINPSNLILINNQVQIIDFDNRYIKYNLTIENIKIILKNYEQLFYILNKKFKLIELPIYYPKSFDNMRKYIKKTENKVRKRIK